MNRVFRETTFSSVIVNPKNFHQISYEIIISIKYASVVGSGRVQILFQNISDFCRFILFHNLLVFSLLTIPTSLALSERMFNQSKQIVEVLCQ